MTTRRSNEDKYAEGLKNSMSILVDSGGAMAAWNDVKNAELEPCRVQDARKLEMNLFKEMGGVHQMLRRLRVARERQAHRCKADSCK